jgi:HK97 gp10 family phage protein
MAMTWDQGKIDARVRAAALRGVVAGVEAVLTEGTRLIATPPKTGRVYKLTNPRRTHQASAPGQAPATDLGGLIASGRAIYPSQGDLLQITGTANWSADYARALELGTEKMDPRPYARPALDTVAPKLQSDITAEMRKEFSK